ncbi:MAG: hypothetical protein AAB449_00220 [Patescibacteria group bacterium]
MGDTRKERGFNAYFPDLTTAVLVPKDADRNSVVRVEGAKESQPVPPTPLARSVQEETKILAAYQPSKKELELVAWAQDRFAAEPGVAAEVHGVIYRSFKTVVLATQAQHMEILQKARELGVGFPEPEFRPRV